MMDGALAPSTFGSPIPSQGSSGEATPSEGVLPSLSGSGSGAKRSKRSGPDSLLSFGRNRRRAGTKNTLLVGEVPGSNGSVAGETGAKWFQGIMPGNDVLSGRQQRKRAPADSADASPGVGGNDGQGQPPSTFLQPSPTAAHSPEPNQPHVGRLSFGRPRGGDGGGKDSTLGKGSRIVDLQLLLRKLEQHMVCRSCAEWRQKQALLEYGVYLEQLLPRRLRPRDGLRAEDMPVGTPEPGEAVESFLKSRQGRGASLQKIPTFELVAEDCSGAASALCFKCRGLSRTDDSTDARPGDGHSHRFVVYTSAKVADEGAKGTAKWAVNQRLALAALQSGTTAGDWFSILTLLGIPVARNFAFSGTSWRTSERTVGRAVESISEESCMEALRDEVELTIAAKRQAMLEVAARAAAAAETAAEGRRSLGLFGSSDEEDEVGGAGGRGEGEVESDDADSSGGGGGGGGRGRGRGRGRERRRLGLRGVF